MRKITFEKKMIRGDYYGIKVGKWGSFFRNFLNKEVIT